LGEKTKAGKDQSSIVLHNCQGYLIIIRE